MNSDKITVAVVLGGVSPEREVSKESGKSLYEAVIKLGYKVKLVDPAYGTNQLEKPEDYFSKKDHDELKPENYVNAIQSNLFDDVDVALLALHGEWGEDGKIQSLLEFKGIKYTGSGVLGSSLTMDKARSKVMFEHFGVPTPKWIALKKSENNSTTQSRIEQEIGFPCIVKPNDQGSTIGLTKCLCREDLEEALNLALRYSQTALVEEFIKGREIAVTVVNGEVLPLLEIIPKHEIYDYECKYTDGMSEYIVPAIIDENVREFLKEKALTAFESLGCEDYGRVDFRLTKNNEAFCFEVNTLPGMTSHSLVPKMANAAGVEFTELVDMIIKSAL